MDFKAVNLRAELATLEANIHRYSVQLELWYAEYRACQHELATLEGGRHD